MKRNLFVALILTFAGSVSAFAGLGDIIREIGEELLEEIGEEVGEDYWEGNNRQCRVRPAVRNNARQLTNAAANLAMVTQNQVRWSHFAEESRELLREARDFNRQLDSRISCYRVREEFRQVQEEFQETVQAWEDQRSLHYRPQLENSLERVIQNFRQLRRSLRNR